MLLISQKMNGIVLFRLIRRWYSSLSKAFAKQYIKQGHGGKIININSMLSYQGGIRVPSYTASKSAGMGLTKAMCNEWACHNINVNAIA